MATTIQVRERTQQRLGILKKEYGAASYDDLINRLVDEKFPDAKSMFGSCKGLGPWTKKDRARSKYE